VRRKDSNLTAAVVEDLKWFSEKFHWSDKLQAVLGGILQFDEMEVPF
jgi:hypothetical protein